MKPLHLGLGAVAAAAAVVAFGAWSPALAQKAKSAKLPGFPYEIQNGKRVPKADRIVAADGSWKEEAKSGNCVTVREMAAPGEYREVRKCD
jgi:hypothetical protein